MFQKTRSGSGLMNEVGIGASDETYASSSSGKRKACEMGRAVKGNPAQRPPSSSNSGAFLLCICSSVQTPVEKLQLHTSPWPGAVSGHLCKHTRHCAECQSP